MAAGHMNSRERFRALMSFAPVDRLPLVEWAAWWDDTVLRWHREGLPADITDRYEICRYFGLETYRQGWFHPTHWECPGPPAHGVGVVADENDYDRLRPYFFRILEDWPVNLDEWRQWAAEQRRGDAVLWFTMDGFFWHPRTLLGIEPHFYAFYDQPELIHRINNELSDWMIRIVDRLCAVCTPDFMTFAEDMSYNHGPMLSRDLFNEFMLPYYRKVVPRLKERGILAVIDSDGDITKTIPWFEEAGLDGILPLERQAGVDVVDIRQRHPRMRFIGCYDKMVMTRGEAAMRAEFERLLPAARQGGLIIGVDHQTPPGVSLEQFRSYLRLYREYAEKAARG